MINFQSHSDAVIATWKIRSTRKEKKSFLIFFSRSQSKWYSPIWLTKHVIYIVNITMHRSQFQWHMLHTYRWPHPHHHDVLSAERKRRGEKKMQPRVKWKVNWIWRDAAYFFKFHFSLLFQVWYCRWLGESKISSQQDKSVAFWIFIWMFSHNLTRPSSLSLFLNDFKTCDLVILFECWTENEVNRKSILLWFTAVDVLFTAVAPICYSLHSLVEWLVSCHSGCIRANASG